VSSTSARTAFREGLAEAGYVEGRNVTIEYRRSEGRVERYPELVADLLRHQVTVIAALGGIPSAMAAKAATTTIPIVFAGGFDPVEIGLVTSFARPGGNLTGTTSLAVELGPKRLEAMHELLPAAKVFALLLNPDHPNAETESRGMQTAARVLGVQIRIVHARDVREFDMAFATVAQLGAAGLMIGIGQPLAGNSGLLGELAARHRVPAIAGSRDFVAAGGLLSYTGNSTEATRGAGIYAGRILKGEKPGDLPVQQATKVELIINMKTAKALGLTIPETLLATADEVIQ
jgi:putative tryptophan/tyrosine transport system substrate-binding protein